MTDEEMIEEQNAYYMAGYPSRRSENKTDKDEREKQIEIDAEQIRALQKQNGELTDKVKELEAQIEKMKCCETCRYYDYHEIGTGNKDCILWYRDKVFCEHKNMWELGR